MKEKNLKVNLDARLLCAASMVRKGSVVLDVGTDHAYVPLYLLQNGISSFAAASDINNGPLERAQENAKRYALSEKMRFLPADGIDDGECVRDGVSDILICGMGGELIADIIDRSEYAKKDGVRVILQPMTMGDALRRYLAENGFSILDEKLCAAGGRIYSCILAEHTGKREEYSDVELMLGRINIAKREPLFEKYAAKFEKKLEVKIDGMKKGGLCSSKEELCLTEIKKLLNKK